MIRMDLQLDLQYDIDAHGADFVFNIHAAHTPWQVVMAERLVLSQHVQPQLHTDPITRNRYMRLRALPGTLRVTYTALVDITHQFVDPGLLAEVPVSRLPFEVISYLYPSRYCQSDQLVPLAMGEFGSLPQGHARVLAIQNWVRQRVTFTSNTSNSATSALDTLNQGTGVCRDFAHVMIALCRAVNIPARFTTGTDYGADPGLGPPDFHAYVEVFLGHGWYIFDPSGTAIPMGFVRLGTGRDAADVSVATMFGGVKSYSPMIRAVAVSNLAHAMEQPHPSLLALSTDGRP